VIGRKAVEHIRKTSPAPRPATVFGDESLQIRFNLWLFPHLALPLHSSILGLRFILF